MVVKILEGDARLDDRVRELLINLKHLVHAMEVKCNGARQPWSRPAISDVLPTRERPNGYSVFIRYGEDALQLFDRRRASFRMSTKALISVVCTGDIPDRSTWYLSLYSRFINLVRIGVVIQSLASEYGLYAQHTNEFIDSLVEFLLADAGWQDWVERSNRRVQIEV